MRTVLTPSCPEELFRLLDRYPEALLMAGGTDLLVRLRQPLPREELPLICLGNVKRWCGIYEEGDRIAIGAVTTFAHILPDPLIRQHAPLLSCAAGRIGGPAIRNMATIGGNLCTASPAGDSLTPLYLLDARIEIVSNRSTRTAAIRDFIVGPGRTALVNGEVVSRIFLPRAVNFSCRFFEKIGLRKAMTISVASMAGLLRFSEDGALEEARFAWGSVAPTILRIPSLEEELTGHRLNADRIRRAAHIVRKEVTPISDIRATAAYRRMVAGNLLTRFLEGYCG